MFKQRAITVLIALPLVVAVVWFGQPWVVLLAALWGLGGAYEFYYIVRKSKNLIPLTFFGLLWTLLFILRPVFPDQLPLELLVATTVIFSLVLVLMRSKKEDAFSCWAWTLAGIFYVGWLLSFLVALRNLPDGRGWVFLALLATFASDITAYLIGRALGKHKLAPFVSPNKTWEGAVAGVVGAVVISTLVPLVFNLPVAFWQAILLGLLISVFGQVGDLVKSLFKRNMGVKDSGHVFPGHGGFLDRMDSVAFAGLLVYFYVVFPTLFH
jgi:phosphatidate cytidylyltransferase